MHRQNAAEKAIQTWKNHFLAGLASLPKDFPIIHWCRLIPQANITLNLLRPCRQNTALSAHAAIHGSYAFEATPMAPPGTKAYIHIKPHKRASWGFKAEDAWYVGPAMEHYRNAVRNAPTDAPPDYLTAVQRLRAVLLKEKQPQREILEEETIPQRNPNQIKPPPSPPTNNMPNNSPVLIPCDDDEVEPQLYNDDGHPIQAPRQAYQLRNRAVNIINSTIIEETPNVKGTTHDPKHVGKYTEAIQFIAINEAFKRELYSPTGLFAGAIIDPDTGKQLGPKCHKVERPRMVEL